MRSTDFEPKFEARIGKWTIRTSEFRFFSIKFCSQKTTQNWHNFFRRLKCACGRLHRDNNNHLWDILRIARTTWVSTHFYSMNPSQNVVLSEIWSICSIPWLWFWGGNRFILLTCLYSNLCNRGTRPQASFIIKLQILSRKWRRKLHFSLLSREK